MSDILIHGIIGREVRSQRVLKELAEASKPIQVIINSKGGDAFEIAALFNAIAESGADTLIDGQAFSAAGVLALAGKKVRMKENALLMLHGTGLKASGTMNIPQMKEALEVMAKVEDAIITTIVSKTKKERVEIEDILSRDSFFTPQEALDAGFIDEIVPVKGNKIDLAGFTNLPERIVAFVESNREEPNMSFVTDLANALELEIKDEKDYAVVLEVVSKKFKTLTDSVAALTTEKEELEKKANPPKHSHPKTYVNQGRKLRSLEIESLVKDGKITAALAKKMQSTYCSDAAVIASLDDDSNEDSFENMITMFKENDAVVNLGGRSGVQVVGDTITQGEDDEKNRGLLEKLRAKATNSN
jgi:ATP-dependent protease ClpP protease subunit